MSEITLYQYPQEEADNEQATTVTIARLARSLDNGTMADLIGEYVNVGMKDFADGYAAGHKARKEHRTIQRSIVCFALGILCGISEQESTDERNATAIATAKKVKDLVEAGQLPTGMLI